MLADTLAGITQILESIHNCDWATQMHYLKNLVSSCQLLRLVGDAAGRNVRDEDSSVSLSPDDVEPKPLALWATQLYCTLNIGVNVSVGLWGDSNATVRGGW